MPGLPGGNPKAEIDEANKNNSPSFDDALAAYAEIFGLVTARNAVRANANALAADAQFCANCGTPVPDDARRGDGKSGESDQTMFQAQPPGDPWEG